MKEISLHILDIAQNSIAANANCISVIIIEDPDSDKLTVEISDNGEGMDEEFIKYVTDPFMTTRTTRKVGLGLPLFKFAAESTGGYFEISSEKGKGTKVLAGFKYSHIDRMPLGDISGTIITLIRLNSHIDFIYKHRFRNREVNFSTAEVREKLGDLPIDIPEVMEWISDYLKEQSQYLYGGA